MIVKDIKQLQEVPIGTEVLYVQKIRVVDAQHSNFSPCAGCIFCDVDCPSCRRHERLDGKEVKFVKI